MQSPHAFTKRTRKIVIGAVIAGLTLLGTTACGADGPSTSSSGAASAAKAGFDASAPLAADVPAQYKSKGTIEVATQPDFEPANFTPVGQTGIQGYNIDLMNAMAKQLGLQVHWNEVPFDQILIGMQSKKFDAAIAGMTDHKQRQEQADFIDYQWAGTDYMTQKGNPKHITGGADGACGLKIGDVKGSDAITYVDQMAAACAKEGKPPTTLVSFPNTSDKNLALTSGRIDAIFWPDLAVSVLQRETGNKLQEIPADFITKVYLGMTFNKQDTGLRDAFMKALLAIHKNGEYADILKKWKVQVIDLETPGINLAQN